MSYDFTSIWIIGASTGIGRAVAEKLASQGVKVAASARSEDKLKELEAAFPDHIKAWPVDVTDTAALNVMAADIDTAYDGLGCMMYCAAAWEPTNAQDVDPERFARNIAVNVMGAVNALAAIGAKMEQRRAGRLAIVSSVAGYSGLPNAAEYGTTKAALTHMCESLKFKYDQAGVVMQVITPGFVKTQLTDKNEFPMPFIISAQKAAEYICEGFKSRGFEITFPKRFTFMLKFLRVLPYPLYFWLVGKTTQGKA
ncbi:MAG: SDR family NAD(P)-dependent oxidoreductase [Pseudomonadota bacterium]